MKIQFDITKICNYDGQCSICTLLGAEHEHGWCYGERIGTNECPLKSKMIEIEANEEYVVFDAISRKNRIKEYYDKTYDDEE